MGETEERAEISVHVLVMQYNIVAALNWSLGVVVYKTQLYKTQLFKVLCSCFTTACLLFELSRT